MARWFLCGEYADGFSFEKYVSYCENGNYHEECLRQQQLEEYLISLHDDCIYYSVCVVND